MRTPLLAVLLAGCPKALPPDLEPQRELSYETADGWTVPLRHYPGEGPPLLLVHGMSANTRNWDYRDEVSFVPELVDAGYDVWIPAMRGDPGATHPVRRARRSYTFDDHARYDLPAAVDEVLRHTGHDAVLWVGHSMGGMLLYTALAHYPEKVRAGVAISSPGVFEHPLRVHGTAAHAAWLFPGNGMIPTRGLARLGLGLGLAKALAKRVAAPDALDRDLLPGMVAHVLNPVSKPTARQAIGWLRGGALTTVDGEPWLADADVPLLLMAGPLDGVVSEPDVAATCARFSRCDYVQLSAAAGFSHDYGHVDPVVGRTAHDEVLPRVLAFLDAHRSASPWDAARPAAALVPVDPPDPVETR